MRPYFSKMSEASPQGRAAKLDVLVLFVLCDVLSPGPIVLERAAQPARLRIGVDIGGDVGVAEGSRVIGFEFFFRSATTASTARSMPRLRSIGFMPAATALEPKRKSTKSPARRGAVKKSGKRSSD
jgi:hypothetical protein